MTDLTSPYIPHKPGELITAEDWNDMQTDIKKDIGDQISSAVSGIGKVPSAGDADKLSGQTAAELTDAILKKLKGEIPGLTGYRMYFKRLTTGDENVIQHNLAAAPLVDIYQLEYFPVVCANGDQKTPTWVNFYIYHSSERRIRITVPGPPAQSFNIEIEPSEKSHPFKIRFTEMLDRFKVQYTDSTSLSDLVNDFWNAVFEAPNDEFDQDQYCHSPWFDRCCCVENATVKTVRDRGDLDDLYVKWMPKKTVNFPYANPTPVPNVQTLEEPQNILVEHFDFNTLGLKMLRDPVYPPAPTGQPSDANINKKELKVMVLLKV